MFNRDEPDREKQVHVTVKASDHGKPPLEDVCTIAVKIKDINDNAPIFDRANYDVPVPQVRQNMENVLETFFQLISFKENSFLSPLRLSQPSWVN